MFSLLRQFLFDAEAQRRKGSQRKILLFGNE